MLEEWTTLGPGDRYVFVSADRPVMLRLTVDNSLDGEYWAFAFDAFEPALLQGAPRPVSASI